METKALTILWGVSFCLLSIEVSVLFFQSLFHFCFHDIISFDLPDIALALESDEHHGCKSADADTQ
jgi:hypothetical protein